MSVYKYSDDEIVVEVVDEEDMREAIAIALDESGCTWQELEEEARTGRFSSEVARQTWFVVSSLVKPSAA